MRRRLFPLLFVASVAAGCGGGSSPATPPALSGPTPSAGTSPNAFAAAAGPITLLNSNASGAIGTTLLPTSAGGVFIVQAPSQPAQDFTASPNVTTYDVAVSESGGLAAAAQSRMPASVDGHTHGRLDGDRENRWDVPQTDFNRTRDLLSTVRGIAAGRRVVAAVRRPRATLNDQHTFHILAGAIGNTSQSCASPRPGFVCYADVTATLKYQGAHGNIWVDNVSLNTPGEFTNPSDFATVGADFDRYYASETAVFGPAFLSQNIDFQTQCDANGQKLTGPDVVPDLTGSTGDSTGQRVDVVITDLLSSLGEGGYFFGGNLVAQTVLNCQSPPRQISNEVPMFVIGGNNYTSGPNLPQFNENFWLTSDVPRTMSHEFQHYLHFMNKVLRPIAQGAPGGVQDDAFIDEGVSMLAEDLFANGIAIDTPRFTYSFMLEPNLFALTSFTGFQPNPTSTAATPPYGYYTNTAGSYGQAYLFMRYIYDRFGGDAAMQRLYASQTIHVGPIVAAANGEAFAPLYAEFVTALAAQTSGDAIVSDPRYRFGPEITLRGAVNVTSRRTPPFDTRHFVFGGPQAPETFSSGNVPTGVVKLSPGQTATIPLIAGATAFFPLTAAGGGATLRATSALPILQGGMVQGPLPSPQPTAY